jgi:NAD(P)H-dependent FMN reductase
VKLLAFAASNSRASINRRLIDHATERFRDEIDPHADIEILDLNDFEMPIYSIDRETETGVPPAALTFLDKIGQADALLVSFAEHNGSVSAAWKNLFDWMSRANAKVWQGKPMVVMAATPGPRAGAGVLQHQSAMAPFFGADIRGSVGVGRWPEAFDAATCTLTQADHVAALGAALVTLTPQRN